MNKKKNIGFSQNIVFCREKPIKRMLKKGIHVSKITKSLESCYGVEEGRRGKKIGTDGIRMCVENSVMGGNTQNNLVLHIFPDDFFKNLSENLIKLNNKFKETASLLKIEKKEAKALIFGGKNCDYKSRHLLTVFEYFMDKFHVDYSAFWGTRAFTEKSMFYNGKNNTSFVSVVKDKGRFFIPEEKLLKKDEILDAFDYIKVFPEDRVKFSDTGWISGRSGILNKRNIKDLSMEEVLKNYNVNPKSYNL